MPVLARRLAAAVLLLAAAMAAAAQQATEPAVKAALLYRFAAYVEWPPGSLGAPDGPIVFGTIAADDVAIELEKILPGRMIHERRAVVRRLREGESVKGTHILFVGRRTGSARAIARAASEQGAIVVGESGLEPGVAINFVVEEARVTFEVSLEAAERSGHRISSRMLAVARRVVPRGAS